MIDFCMTGWQEHKLKDPLNAVGSIWVSIWCDGSGTAEGIAVALSSLASAGISCHLISRKVRSLQNPATKPCFETLETRGSRYVYIQLGAEVWNEEILLWWHRDLSSCQERGGC
ncbi:hypothetical protein AOLI_G00081670 [Acnodon oligacanthus]